MSTWDRVLQMHPGEVPHRIRERLRRRMDRRIKPPVAGRGGLPRWPHDPRGEGLGVEALVAGLLEEGFTLLGQARTPEQRTQWNRDPATGETWPSDYCFDIDLGVRDPKPAWELHRLQHLPVLAVGDVRAVEACRSDLFGWIEANPPWEGMGWAVGIEVACRAVSLALAASALEGQLSGAQVRVLRDALTAHGWWLQRYPSLYSSANNHRIAELGALAVLGAITDLPGASAWFAEGVEGLRAEIGRQVLADGVGAEQSPSYQAFTMEWYLLARAVADLGAEVDAVLAAGADYLASLVDEVGNHPHIGDHDGGRVLMTAFEEPKHVCSIAGATAMALGRPELAPTAWRPDLRAAWLGIRSGSGDYRHRSRTFPVGGLTALVAEGWLAWMDHGPLGFPDLAAHGHADALSIWLHVDGTPVLVDTGTYAYNAAPESRRWFRSTEAHNTATVDGGQQSEALGSFLWRTRATGRVLEARHGESAWVRADTDAWGEVRHERTVSLTAQGLVVEDRFEGAGRHTIRLCLHFDAALDLVPCEGGFDVNNGDAHIARLLAEGSLIRTRRAPAYGVLEEGVTWVLEAEVSLPWTHSLLLRP